MRINKDEKKNRNRAERPTRAPRNPNCLSDGSGRPRDAAKM
jgi:hypothetical protein